MSAKLKVIADCWSTYEAAAIPPGASGRARDFARSTFYAGVAFMFDMMMANVDNEDAAVATLESVSAELDDHSWDLAERGGIDLDKLRDEIAAQLKARRG